MGPKLAQGLRADQQSVVLHCASMPEKIKERRLRVAVANSQGPFLATTAPEPDVHQAQAFMSWANMMGTESPFVPPMLDDLDHRELGDGDAEFDANSDFLNMVDIEEEEDDSLESFLAI